jgi:SAM-dependent methyltransferase
MGEIIAWPKPSSPMPFTGERLTSEFGGQTQIEHLHRYLLAREWCRGKDVLDVASGEGYGTALLAQVARNVVGVEISPEAVAHASGAYRADNLGFVVGDARVLPCPDAAFDVVTSFETIEHFAEQGRFLDEIRRVLRPSGHLIISTPDRDNYSPAESPANPYHVKELTAAEFDTLLRARFSGVSVLLQRPIFGSVLLPTGGCESPPLCFERRGDQHFEGSTNLSRPQYVVAFASNGHTIALPPSVYIDTGRLGMLSPPEAEARLRLALSELDSARATASRDHAQERAAFQTELSELKTELLAARDEVKGLVAANEMAERACALMRSQLAGRQQGDGSATRSQNHAAELDVILASTSWRVTAPLRAISRVFRRSHH